MESIYILTVSNEESSDDWFFTTHEKAKNFIKDNFALDNPREITSEIYQGRHHNYIINNQAVNQVRC